MKLPFSFLFSFFCFFSFSQEKATKVIDFNNIKVSTAFLIIEKKYNVKLSYTDKIIKGKMIFLKNKNRSLIETLAELSKALNLDFQFINKRFITVTISTSVFNSENYNELDEVVITSYLAKGIIKDKNGAFKITLKELEILPGLVEADVLESIQELPGVISPNETATGLNVRGGTPDQNQIIWDGFSI